MYLASALLIGVFMRWIGRYGWQTVLPIAIGVPVLTFIVFEKWFLVPLPKGPIEDLLGSKEDRRMSAQRTRGRGNTGNGRNRQSVPRLRHGGAAVQHHGDGRRHRARRRHRGAARPRRRQRRCDPAAAHILHVADFGDHHVVVHLLGCAVRRRDHVHLVQHPRRTVVGGDDVRWPPDGSAGPRRRGTHRRLHLVVRGRAVRGHHDHVGGAAWSHRSRCGSDRPRSSACISSPSAASSE